MIVSGQLIAAFIDRRKHLGMTQTDLAVAAGMTQSSISQKESGKRRMTVEDAVAISQVLGFRLSELIRQIEDGEDLVDTPRTIVFKGKTYWLVG